MSAAAPPKFEMLDGLRGIGALIVLIGHTALFWIGRDPGPLAAAVMVDMFFMLSGFVIAFAYEPKIARGSFGVRRFMEARIIRLYPLFLLSMVLGMIVNMVVLYGETDDWLAPLWHFSLSAFAIPVYDPEHHTSIYPLNMPAWTLLYEVLVNLIYILLWRWLSVRVLIGLVVLGAVGLYLAGSTFGSLNVGPDWSTTIGAFARAWFGYFVGVLVYRLTMHLRAEALPRTWWVFAVIAVVVAIAIHELPTAGTTARLMQELFFICVMGPILIYLGQRMEPPKAISPLFVWLGAVSYALYLLHWPIYLLALRLPAKLGMTPEATAPYMGIAVMIIAVTAAALAERYYDQPVRAWVSGLLKRRAAKRKLVTSLE